MKQARIKYWLAFTPEWFERHQGALLWLANNRWLGGVFRRCINLRPDMRVTMITPDAVNYATDGPECVLVAYTGPAVAMDVYRAFKPLWWAIHYWDEFVADRWIPELSYGFDTLTQNTELTPSQYFDGAITSDATGQAAANAASGSAIVNIFMDNDQLQLDSSYVKTPLNYSFSRLFFKFNLTSITGQVAVSNAVFSIGAGNRFNESGAITIREATIADSNTTLSNTTGGDGLRDWQRINPTTYVAYNGISVPYYSDTNGPANFTFFNGTLFGSPVFGLDFIRSKMGGVLKLAMQSPRDGGTGITSQWYINFYGRESGTAGARPKMTITYTRAMYPTGLSDADVFGTVSASNGPPLARPASIESTNAFGTLTIARQVYILQPSGLANVNVFGTFRDATIRPSGLANVNNFGAPFLARTLPASIVNVNAFGTFTITTQAFQAKPAGIATQERFGQFITTSPFPDVYISRLIDQPIEYGYEVYQFEDGSADVNVQPCGARRWTLEYEGLSKIEILQLLAHYNLMRGSSGTFSFYHRRDAVTYSGVRYVSLTIPQRQRAWSNAATIVLEKLQ